MAFAIGITLYLTYLVFRSFLSPILLGAIFSIVFHPVHLKLLKLTKGRKALSSISVCLLITLLIIVPLIYLAALLTSEIREVYIRINEVVKSGNYEGIFPFMESPAVRNLYEKADSYLKYHQIDAKEIILNSLNEISSYSIRMLTGAAKNLLLSIINLFLMLFTMYYLFKDSDIIASEVDILIPLTPQQKDRIFARLKDIIYATLYGTFAAASAQGLLGGMAFWILGIGSPVLWGTVMGLLAIMPMLGAFLVWLPASLMLLIQGSYIKALILFLWGSLVISMVDNLIRPLLMSGRAMLHPLATFFSILGGIIVFGPIGLFAGPFAVVLLLILIDIIKEVTEPERITTGS